ncbi:MAG: VWA domain-containing protein [Anaerolineales bacterium]|nr:MAG: VWA domain-containing protein [Anaerolineales bacterium]
MATSYLDNYYARLGIPRDASQDEIQRAYRRAARQFHPDANKNTGASELFLLVQEAFETLQDPPRRREYDTTLPEDIEAPPALMVNALYSRPQITPDESGQVIYVLLDLKPSASEEERRRKPPLNVALVLDTSTSMAGARLGQVVKAASHFVSQLSEHDILSVITFNDRAQVVVPAQPGLDIQRLISRFSTLQTSGGTEIYQGLKAGLVEVQRHLRPSATNHIVLITDGRTYGDEAACLELAGQAAQQGIPISAIGIGDEWNEEFVDQLVAKSGGSSLYADKSADIHTVLENRLHTLSLSYANNVKLSYENGAMSKLNYVFRLSPDLGPVSLPQLDSSQPIFLGNVPQNDSLSVLLEFELDSSGAHDGYITLAEGRLSLDVPTRPIPSNSARFQLTRQISEIVEAEAPPNTLISAIGKLSLYRMQERARQELEHGDPEAAAKRMRMLATRLLSQGQRSLARTVLLAAEDLKENEALGAKEGKQIKYGTRALIDDTEGRGKRGSR